VPPLRWAAGFFAQTHAGADARACANALARIAGATGHPEALGEPVAERLGPGAARRFRSGDLTRRQREILQLVARGQTNAEIARALVLSPRTVEMQIANILATLDSRSRAEAVRRATERGLLEAYGMAPEKIP
jgi:DNA-binding NarL/FixJ family response regulator